MGRDGWRDQLTAVCSQTGQEWMRFRSGGVIQFSTRTKSSRLGFSFDIVVYDEAQELTGVHVQVINPTTTSGDKHNLQLIYAGTPTRAGNPAEVFRNVREQAWEGGERAADLMWLEYGDEEMGDIWDESRWWSVMPSLGAHADARAIRAGMKDMDELGAAQEYLGYWLPAAEQVERPVIGADEWAACEVERAPEACADERVAYGVKFSPDGALVALGYQSGLTDSLIAGVSFAVVGRDENGACLRWHTAQTAAGLWDYANARLACGFAIVNRCRKRSAASGYEHWDTVPSEVDFYTEAGCWEISREDASSPWEAVWNPDDMGEPRMVALVFRPDGRHPLGRSRFTVPMRGIVQEYMANALNLHVASEFTAVGQKWATGLTDAQLEKFASNKWGTSADSVVLATDNPESGGNPQFGNFTQQSMEPVLSVKRSLATDFAAAASIPVADLLTQDSNPTSAEALTAMQNKLISLVEGVNARNSRVLRKIALMLMAVEGDTTLAGLTDEQRGVMVHMRTPETVSVAGQSDAMLKRIQGLPYLAESDVAIEQLGFTDDQVPRVKSARDRYYARQMVAQAVQSSGLDLSGAPSGGDGA